MNRESSKDIAIIGIGLKVANVNTPEELWSIFENKEDLIISFPEERKSQILPYARMYQEGNNVDFYKGSYLQRIDEFDNDFFKISPKEAQVMDPVQRLSLEVMAQTIDDAGYLNSKIRGTKTGVFCGYTASSLKDNYVTNIVFKHRDLLKYAVTGNISAIIPSRIAHIFDLKGPVMVLDTACSSSLVAVHEACESINRKEVEFALAGGIKINTNPVIIEELKIGVEAEDNKTRTFSDGATGAAIGEGIAFLMLESLEMAEKKGDHIYATIKGSAINHDGNSTSITAPNPAAQKEVLIAAWENADINPREIDYIEAHGTGTRLGDPIEIQGMQSAFEEYTQDKQFCAVSAAKTNIGHLYECSGVVAVIKAVMALEHKKIPGIANLFVPNSKINFADSPVYINTNTKKWNRRNGRRICGVSAFGLSGTNCHIVLEEYNDNQRIIDKENGILCVSANSQESLEKLVRKYRVFLQETPDFFDAIATINVGHSEYKYRKAWVFGSKENLFQQMEDDASVKKIISVTDGIGSLLDESSQLFIDDSQEAKRKLFFNLEILSELYCQGRTIEWSRLYQKIGFKKVIVPTYVFEHRRFWLPIKADENVREVNEEVFYKRSFVNANFNGRKQEVCKNALLININDNILKKEIRIFFEGALEIKAKIQDKVSDIFSGEYFEEVSHIFIELSTANSFEEEVEGLTFISSLFQEISPKEMNVKIIVFFSGSMMIGVNDEEVNPYHAAIFGLCKSLNRYTRTVHFLCVDRAEGQQGIIAECICQHKEDILVFRENKVFVEAIEKPVIEKQMKRVIRKGGIYLFTGGLGGIAYAITCELLRQERDVIIILVGREKIYQSNNRQKINRLQYITETAAQTEYINVDISNKREMEKLFGYISERYGNITGIFHTAGIGGGVVPEELSYNKILEIAKAKIRGTQIIANLIETTELDFFVACSSIATIFSSADLAVYIAANMYMEAICQKLFIEHHKNALAINWATWSDTGMSVLNNFTISTIFKAINSEEAVNALFVLLEAQIFGNIVVGQLNLDSKIAMMLKSYPMVYPESVLQSIERLEVLYSNDKTDLSVPSYKEEKYEDVESKLIQVCKDALGYSEMNILDNFFELGADSIILGNIFRELDVIYPNKLNITDLFTYPSIRDLAIHILEVGTESCISSDRSIEFNDEMEENDIAIIGVGMNLPGASNLDEYWEILQNGVSVIREMPEERRMDIEKHLLYQGMEMEDIVFRKCGFLDEINKFDYGYFKMSPRESSLIDPVTRLFMQVAATAIEDAGYGGNAIRGSKTGVFLGYSANLGNAYSRLLYDISPELFNDSLAVNQVSMTASRISYKFDLTGPSMVLDTACSSSLVALHVACEQIFSGNCDMAIVGGASIAETPLKKGFEVGFESAEEKTRAFADNASGSAVAEAVGCVLIKRLSRAIQDGDFVYAVIKGSAINQDGSSSGIAAPNYLAQASVINKAWENANVSSEEVSYIEAHGTGTQLGDPIEISGINKAFENTGNFNKQQCGIGSLKTNLGHSNEASGICGILKLILILNKKIIPPSLNFLSPNNNIDFSKSAVYVANRKQKIKRRGERLIVGISGFGISGTNAHVVMTEPPKRYECLKTEELHIFAFSSLSENALYNLTNKYYVFLKNNDINIDDFVSTLLVGREHHSHRFSFLFYGKKNLLDKLKKILDSKGNWSEQREFYYGHYSIVPDGKMNRQDFEITVNEQTNFTETAKKIVDSSEKSLTQIAELYVKGATIEWDNFVKEQFRRLPVPTYPYERKYCWYEIPFEREDGFFYHKKWVQESNFGYTSSIEPNNILVFANDIDYVSKELQKAGAFVHEITKKMNCGESTEFYKEVFNKTESEEINKIIYCATSQNVIEDKVKSVYETINKEFFDILHLIKNLSCAHWKQDIELILLVKNVNAITQEEVYLDINRSLIVGLGKVIPQEFPNVSVRVIDYDETTHNQIIAREILANSSCYLVGYRNNLRYCEMLEELVLKKTNQKYIFFNGVYLITGGTNGIGIEIAELISRKEKCHIILLGRHELDVKRGEDKTLTDENILHKYDIIRKIEERGCSIDILVGDVSSRKDMERVFTFIHNKYGRISGIFHSAGISGAGYIMRKEEASYLKVMEPKVRGTIILDELSREDEKVFMVLCSSAVTDVGEAGQSDYVAANSFLDAYTSYRNHQGYPTYTVNWVSWKETGMSVRHGINRDSVTKALATEDALNSLDCFLQNKPGRIMIGQYDFDQNLSTILQYFGCMISESLQNKVFINPVEEEDNGNITLNDGERDYAKIKNGKLIFVPKSENAEKRKKNYKEVKLKGEIGDQYTEYEKKIGTIYATVLGYDCINIYDNFFEMGGDSVMLAGMHDMIEELYPDCIRIAELFEYPSIKTLAKYIEEKVMHHVIISKTEMQLQQKFPLSVVQERIYFEYRISKNKKAYNNPFMADVSMYENKKIEDMLYQLVCRHRLLRAVLRNENGNLYWHIDNVPDNLQVTYLTVEDVDQINIEKLLMEFNLKQGPLYCFTICSDGNKKYLLFDVHHLILDGFSSSLLQEDMYSIIENKDNRRNYCDYSEYVRFENDFYASEKYSSLKKYWEGRLGGARLNCFSEKREKKKGDIYSFIISLDQKQMNRLSDFSRKNKVSQFSCCYAFLCLAISRVFQMKDIGIHTTVLNRYEAKFNNCVGVFTNYIILRTMIPVKVDLSEFIGLVGDAVQKDLEHQYYQYNDLVNSIGYRGADINFYLNYEDVSMKKIANMKEIRATVDIPKYDVDFNFRMRNGMFDLEVCYKTDYLTDKEVHAIVNLFCKILEKLEFIDRK